MKIISKFHDYYDTVLAFGDDPNVLYFRKQIELLDRRFEKYRKDTSTRYSLNDPYNTKALSKNMTGIVFFCGKRYRFVKLSYMINSYESVCKTFYDFESIDRFILTHYKGQKRSIKRYFTKDKYEKTSDQDKLKIYWNDVYYERDNYDNNVNYHQEFKSPVFMTYTTDKYSEENVIINPVLKDFEFQKVFDAFSAYQELDMFMSGVMRSPEKEMIQISDEDQRDKKGFDNMSFKPKMRAKYELEKNHA